MLSRLGTSRWRFMAVLAAASALAAVLVFASLVGARGEESDPAAPATKVERSLAGIPQEALSSADRARR